MLKEKSGNNFSFNKSLEAHTAEAKPSYNELEAILSERNQQIEFLTSQLLELKRHVFGRRSEQFLSDTQQPLFVDEEIQSKEPEPEEIEVKSYKRNGRKKLPEDLPIVRTEYEPEEQNCPNCDKELAKVGEEVTKQLEYIPASCFQNHLVKIKKACSCCKDKVYTGSLPADVEVFERCKAGPGLVSYILVSKYCDHQPLHRQEQIFFRQGIEISRKSMSGWVMRSTKLLEQVVEAMKEQILESNTVHADESHLLVQKEQGYSKGYFWGMLANKQVVFEYSPSRAKDTPERMFAGYEGFIQADGYAGYNSLFDLEKSTRVGCWAHVRRKFFELELPNPEQRKVMLSYIKKLYQVDRKSKEEDAPVGYRKEHSLPVLKEIKLSLDTWNKTALPKSPLGKAVKYALNQWQELNIFTEYDFLDLDNNPIERQIRPIALGRKNWLFAGSKEGAKSAAIIFSIINSCKINRIDPMHYLSQVLPKLSGLTPEQIKKITPANWLDNK